MWLGCKVRYVHRELVRQSQGLCANVAGPHIAVWGGGAGGIMRARAWGRRWWASWPGSPLSMLCSAMCGGEDIGVAGPHAKGSCGLRGQVWGVGVASTTTYQSVGIGKEVVLKCDGVRVRM